MARGTQAGFKLGIRGVFRQNILHSMPLWLHRKVGRFASHTSSIRGYGRILLGNASVFDRNR
jgi:hypothetical protein